MQKKTVAIILSCILAFSAVIFAFADNSNRAYDDVIWDDEDTILNNLEDISSTPNSSRLNTSSTLPSSVDLSNKLPQPGNQYPQKSCVAWATAYALTCLAKEKYGWTVNSTTHQFSPAFIYNSLKHGSDTGLRLSQGPDFVLNNGCCSMTVMPFNAHDCSTQPNNNQKAIANLLKIM